MHYSLGKRSNGYYEARWTEPGQKSRYFSLRTKKKLEARKRFAQFVATQTKTQASGVTIDAICNDYIKLRGKQVKHPDQLEYALNPIKDHMGFLLLEHINSAVIDRYIRHRRPRANSTIVRELANLRAAINWSHIEHKTEKVEFIIPISPSPPRQIWITRDEARKIENNIRTPHVKLFFAMAIRTGQRGLSICELPWDNVLLEHRIIDFGEGSGNKLRAIIPISDDLYPYLVEALHMRTTDWVIEWHGKRVKDVKHGIKNAYKRAGMAHLGSKKHVLRHTAATWMVMDRVDYGDIAKYLGMSKEMVENVYGKHHPDFLRQAANSLSY